MHSSYGKALYYPHIQIQNENWLKLALLYWDGLRRIVPDSVVPSDSNAVRALVDEGILENTSPERYLEQAEKQFLKSEVFARVLGRLSGASRFEFDVEYAFDKDNKPVSQMLQQASQGLLKTNQPEIKALILPQFQNNTEIYIDKLNRSLIRKLEYLGLVSVDELDDKLRLNKALGGFYMMCLASQISESIGAPMVTDIPEICACGEYLSFGKYPDDETFPARFANGDIFSVLLKLGIEFPTPESLEEISILDIIKFREQHKDERKRLRQAIESITTKALTISDPYQLADFLSEQREEIKSATQNHRKALNELKVKSVTSLLSVSAPTAIVSAAALAVSPVALPLTGMGIALSLINWWAEVRKERREKTQASPWHYLLSVKQFS